MRAPAGLDEADDRRAGAAGEAQHAHDRVGVRCAERAAERTTGPARSRRRGGRRRARRRRSRRRRRATSSPIRRDRTSVRSSAASRVAERLEPLERDRGARRRRRGRAEVMAASRHSTALWPPKPNEFESATAAWPLTSSVRARGDVVEVEPLVGLARSRASAARSRSRRASIVAIASTAPAAPSRWPIADFVEETGTGGPSPSAALMRGGLRAVVERRRGAVRVDVVDVLRAEAGVAQRRAGSPGRRRRRRGAARSGGGRRSVAP